MLGDSLSRRILGVAAWAGFISLSMLDGMSPAELEHLFMFLHRGEAFHNMVKRRQSSSSDGNSISQFSGAVEVSVSVSVR